MTKLHIALRLSAGLWALAASMNAPAALAQIAPTALTPGPHPQADTSIAEKTEADSAEAVVITGTRIRRPELISNSPLTTVNAQELTLQGANNIENVLNRLPQFTADANENVSNGSDGTANINLRNLGSNRVLTLINGQRMLPSQAMDINFVPSAIVERIDVATGGASAVYGSDALSGVVNFILRDRLDGVRLDVQSSIADHTNDNGFVRSIIAARGYTNATDHVRDGGKQDVNAAVGKTFLDGRLNITAYAGYRHTDPVLQSRRDVSACALNSASTTFTCGGSSNTPYGTFTPLAGPAAGQKLTNSVDGTRSSVPYVGSTYAYNYAPLNYLQRADDRYNAGAFLHLDITSAAQLYGSFMYMKDKSFSQVAPSALYFGQTYAVTCNNPLLSAGQAQTLCGTAAGTAATQNTLIGYRLSGSGALPRRDSLQHEDFRSMVGIRGDLGSGFSYDASVLRSVAHYDETYLNDISVAKTQRSLLAVSDGKGGAVCRSALDGSDPSCVPVDVFQANAISSAAANYLYAPKSTQGRYALNVISGSVTGDLGELGITSPFAHDGVGIVLGGEHRRETLRFTGDEVALAAGTQNSDGIIAVNEGFGELELPIVQDKPFFRSLTLNGGFRYSDYKNRQDSTGFRSSYTAFTYKGELSWHVAEPLRLRASYNRAIRAPNISELFSNLSLGNVNATDPCAGASPTASLSACQLTGVTAAQYNSRLVIECPADQCTGQFGGNRALKPEKADTYTVGAVLAPHGGRNSVAVGRLLPHQGEGLYRQHRSQYDDRPVFLDRQSVFLRPVPPRSADRLDLRHRLCRLDHAQHRLPADLGHRRHRHADDRARPAGPAQHRFRRHLSAPTNHPAAARRRHLRLQGPVRLFLRPAQPDLAAQSAPDLEPRRQDQPVVQLALPRCDAAVDDVEQQLPDRRCRPDRRPHPRLQLFRSVRGAGGQRQSDAAHRREQPSRQEPAGAGVGRAQPVRQRQHLSGRL